MSMPAAFVAEMAKMLQNLDRWIEKAVAFAESKKFDPNVLMQCRLVPDQYPFVRQVQAACDSAKFAAARLSGKEAPAHPDTEQTVAEVRERIAKCLAFLATVSEKDLEGASSRVVPLSFLPGKGLKGDDYLVEMAVPNFFFHLTTAYAILRHNGVDVGKVDYIGSLRLVDV